MSLSNIKTYFQYTASQRAGIFLLLTLIIGFQFLYFFVDFTSIETDKNSTEKQQWLSLQTEIDAAKQETELDSPKLYPFNPNFITEYKGYKLLGKKVKNSRRCFYYGIYFCSVKLKVVPLPNSLLTLMVCSCASIIFFTIDNPNPVPPIFRVLLLSTR